MTKKNISSISVGIAKYTEKVIDNIIKAHSNTGYVIKRDAQYLAPRDTGKYAKSIKLSETTYDGKTIRTSIYTDATVSAYSGKTYNLGRLLEEGTLPHEIRAVKAEALHFTKMGEDVFAVKVLHPGMIAQPHLIPALQKNIALYKSNIRKAIKEAE